MQLSERNVERNIEQAKTRKMQRQSINEVPVINFATSKTKQQTYQKPDVAPVLNNNSCRPIRC